MVNKDLYIPVAHSITGKSGKFHYISYRIYKITLLLVTVT